MATTSRSLLDVLRLMSAVACDTLDSQVVKKLGRFVDCTSNQAIAFSELSKLNADGSLLHEKLFKQSILDANRLQNQQDLKNIMNNVTRDELAVEFLMVRLALQIKPNLTGCVHIQINPRWSYDKYRIINNAWRILIIFRQLEPRHDERRVCIKIPATWEGLQACRELKKKRIATLATTLFCMEQAVLAEDAGCAYMAPYVNELKAHFDKGHVDEHEAFAFCGTLQQYYRVMKAKIKIMPASLTSMDEVLQLAGVDHITVAPALLAELAATPAEGYQGKIGSVMEAMAMVDEFDVKEEMHTKILTDEGAWRLAFAQSNEGRSQDKMTQAINIFFGMQKNLEALVKKVDDMVHSEQLQVEVFSGLLQ